MCTYGLFVNNVDSVYIILQTEDIVYLHPDLAFWT